MENFIKIENLNFSYGKNKIYDHFNLTIKEGEWVSILGANGAGKTTLVKILVGLYKNYDTITIDGKILNKKNYRDIRKIMGVILDNPEIEFVCETVRDEIAFNLENLQYSKKEIKERIDEISKLLKIEDILDVEPHRLSGGQMQKVSIASALALKPKLLILDEAISMIDPFDKENILKIIKEYHKNENTTIINFTSDIEETIYSDRIVGLYKGQIGIDGTLKAVLSEDRAMKKLGLDLPFIVDLSTKLKLYGLIDDIELDIDKLVNKLWK